MRKNKGGEGKDAALSHQATAGNKGYLVSFKSLEDKLGPSLFTRPTFCSLREWGANTPFATVPLLAVMATMPGFPNQHSLPRELCPAHLVAPDRGKQEKLVRQR